MDDKGVFHTAVVAEVDTELCLVLGLVVAAHPKWVAVVAGIGSGGGATREVDEATEVGHDACIGRVDLPDTKVATGNLQKVRGRVGADAYEAVGLDAHALGVVGAEGKADVVGGADEVSGGGGACIASDAPVVAGEAEPDPCGTAPIIEAGGDIGDGGCIVNEEAGGWGRNCGDVGGAGEGYAGNEETFVGGIDVEDGAGVCEGTCAVDGDVLGLGGLKGKDAYHQKGGNAKDSHVD